MFEIVAVYVVIVGTIYWKRTFFLRTKDRDAVYCTRSFVNFRVMPKGCQVWRANPCSGNWKSICQYSTTERQILKRGKKGWHEMNNHCKFWQRIHFMNHFHSILKVRKSLFWNSKILVTFKYLFPSQINFGGHISLPGVLNLLGIIERKCGVKRICHNFIHIQRHIFMTRRFHFRKCMSIPLCRTFFGCIVSFSRGFLRFCCAVETKVSSMRSCKCSIGAQSAFFVCNGSQPWKTVSFSKGEHISFLKKISKKDTLVT